jgi:branched-subunit amino acid transport protein
MSEEFTWFAIVTTAATVAGVALFPLIDRNIDLPMTTRIGMGFMGAALGTLFGIMMAATFHINEGLLGHYGFPILIATILSVAAQKFLSAPRDGGGINWFDNWFD